MNAKTIVITVFLVTVTVKGICMDYLSCLESIEVYSNIVETDCLTAIREKTKGSWY